LSILLEKAFLAYDKGMISWLQGTVIHHTPTYIVLNVNNVGYKVWIGSESFAKKATKNSKELSVWIYMAVREDAQNLYGFENVEELEFFELLITISGIGPKTAAGILNVASVTMLRTAIATNDPGYLTKVSGIGKKNAEKIVRELKDKLLPGESEIGSSSVHYDSDVLEALKSLGYPERDAREAVKELPIDLKTTSDKIKQALKILGKR
jgi:Holliday junction DNA helicase RuvA